MSAEREGRAGMGNDRKRIQEVWEAMRYLSDCGIPTKHPSISADGTLTIQMPVTAWLEIVDIIREA